MDTTPALDSPANGETYLDTVALLQEEIDRLEAELRVWTQAQADRPPSPTEAAADAEAGRRIDELTALLDERDETIALLWEHLSAIEEAQSARSAEWEQLHRWVEELEHRLGGPDAPPLGEPAERESADALRAQMDAERRAWELQRRQLDAELDRLRRRIELEATPADDPGPAALDQEIRRLRDECLRLAPFEAEAASLNDRVAVLQAQLDHARERLREAEEALRLERDRRESGPSDALPGQLPHRPSPAESTPSERVRALREHLREVHAREEEERKQRQLSARIARLLGRTGARP